MKNLDEIYTEEWFRGDFTPLVDEFDLAAEGLVRMFSRAAHISMLDIGCGPGLLMKGFAARNWSVFGVDGSPHALTLARELRAPFKQIQILDVTTTSIENQNSLVVCTELAEHLPEEHAETLVDAIADNCCGYTVFTAAPPGQDGHHHVNCQPKEYWIELFAGRGMVEDEAKTDELRRRWMGLQRLSHMRKNVMVLR